MRSQRSFDKIFRLVERRSISLEQIHVQDIVDATGLKESTVRKYINMCLRNVVLAQEKKDIYVVKQPFSFSQMEFRELMSQANPKTSLEQQGYRPYSVDDVVALERLTKEDFYANDDEPPVTKSQRKQQINDIATRMWGIPRPLPNDVVLGSRLIGIVGKGNYGAVWEAVDEGTMEKRAIKILDADQLTKGLTLYHFRRGVKAMAHLDDSPGKPKSIVGIMEVDDAGCAFSMEFLENGDLNNISSRGWDEQTNQKVFSTILEAVKFAHDRKIRHRDIKAANIVLRADGTPVLTDFDIADLLFLRTRTASGLGEILWASPEQLNGKNDKSPRSDIYSLGRLLEYLLLKSNPELVIEHVPQLQQIESSYPGYAKIIRKCMMHNVDYRYQTVDELMEDWNKLVAGVADVGFTYEQAIDISRERPTDSGTSHKKNESDSIEGARISSKGAIIAAIVLGGLGILGVVLGWYLNKSDEVDTSSNFTKSQTSESNNFQAPNALEISTKEQFSESDCMRGKVAMPNVDQCCWPGQHWSQKLSICTGTPQKCPIGYVAYNNDCVKCTSQNEEGECWPRLFGGLKKISPATFMFGTSPGSEFAEYDLSESSVRISNAFEMTETEITQEDYLIVMGQNPSGYEKCGPNCPVERVSWHDAAFFCNKISHMKGLPQCYTCSESDDGQQCVKNGAFKNIYKCDGYRLPTEAEWEMAARGGHPTDTYLGDLGYQGMGQSKLLNRIAWYDGNAKVPHPVGQKKANDYGLYDMLGNVWEWTNDWRGHTINLFRTINPTGPKKGLEKIYKGGSAASYAKQIRAACRESSKPHRKWDTVGFRIVRTIKSPAQIMVSENLGSSTGQSSPIALSPQSN